MYLYHFTIPISIVKVRTLICIRSVRAEAMLLFLISVKECLNESLILLKTLLPFRTSDGTFNGSSIVPPTHVHMTESRNYIRIKQAGKTISVMMFILRFIRIGQQMDLSYRQLLNNRKQYTQTNFLFHFFNKKCLNFIPRSELLKVWLQ